MKTCNHRKGIAQVMTGPVLAELIETMVGALNARDIPTAGSILEHFNRELVQKASPGNECSLVHAYLHSVHAPSYIMMPRMSKT